MTDRISFCINKMVTFPNNQYKVKPVILADIVEKRLEVVRPGWNVKTDDTIELQENHISIWDWDDGSKNYLLNADVTHKYHFFEVIDYTSNNSTLTKEQIDFVINDFKNQLHEGIKNNYNLIEKTNLFFKLVKDKKGAHGLLITSSQYVINDKIISIDPELNIKNSYVTYGYLSNDYIIDNGVKTNLRREFALVDNISRKKVLSIEDLASKAKDALTQYISSSNKQLSFSLSNEQVREILMKCDLNVTKYTINETDDVSTILEDNHVIEILTMHINGMNSNDQAIEKFLQRNEAFESKCKELLRSEIIKELRNEIDEIDFDIGVKRQELDELKKQIMTNETIISNQKSEKENLKQLNDSYNDLQKLYTELKENVDQEKNKFLKSIIGDYIQTKTNDSSDPIIIKQNEINSNAEICDNYKDFIKNLKKNLSSCIETEQNIADLSHYMGSAILSGLNIIVCNDPDCIISNSISASLDGCLCSSIDLTDSKFSDAIKALNSINSNTVRIDGALNDLDYSKYFGISKSSIKTLVFACDDKQILNSAPPEIWNYSVFLDLSNCSLLNNMTTFSKYVVHPIQHTEVQQWDYLNKLENRSIITTQQSNHIRLVKSADTFNEDWYLKQYVKQIATSNCKLSEYVSVYPDE